MNLGQELAKLRKARDLGQKEVADLLGESLGERLIRAFERGEKRPSRDRLLRLLTGPFQLSAPTEINQLLHLAEYAELSHKEILGYAPNGDVSPQVQSFVTVATHGALYRTSEGYGARLSDLVTHSTGENPLHVAIGDADFLRGWISRLLQASTGYRSPAITRLVVLSLNPRYAEAMESQGRLRPNFAKLMLGNVEAIRAETGLLVEHRYWPGEPGFHGYLYGDIALCGMWESNEAGHLHVKTPLTEFHRAEDPVRFGGFLRAFGSSPPPDSGA